AQVAPPLREQARIWLERSTDADRLLAASVLLEDPQLGDDAETALQRLSASTNESVRLLARTQLWRVRLREGELTRGEPAQWQAQIDTMPEDLRGGPYFLLAQAYERRREDDRAAAAFLWLPVVSPHDHHLAARACVEAADALVRTGRKTEAVTLYREAVFRYRDTVSAVKADEILTTLQADVDSQDDQPEPE
ncbi:MAG: tetratricopeptide repeat protein, partial [Planctomycetaceae bacterium]